jgi:hypothetical protein
MICAQLGQSGDFGAYSLECSLRMELGPIKILGERPAMKREAEEDWSR